MKKENRKFALWSAAALLATFFVVGYITLGFAWAVLLVLAAALLAIGLAGRGEYITANTQQRLSLAIVFVMPPIAGAVAYTQANGQWWWALSVFGIASLLMWQSYQKSHTRSLIVGAALALLGGVSLHYSLWWTVIVASAIVGGVMLWKQFNPPNLREIYQQIDWDQDAELPVSVMKFGKLPTDYSRVLACERRHWTMIVDPEPWKFGTRLLALLISGTVLVAGWGNLPVWVIVVIAVSTGLYGFQNLLAWLLKYVLVLEDQDGDRRLMLVPSHPFYREILSVKESDLKTPQTITGTIGNLFGYVGYELGTLNERDDKIEQKLRTEFSKLPDKSRSALLINNF